MKFRVVKPIYNTVFFLMLAFISAPLLYVVFIRSIALESTFGRIVSRIVISATCFSAMAYPIWNEVFGFGSYRFLIDKTGVTYKTRRNEFHLNWRDIRHIAVNPDRYGRVTRNCYICFISDDFSKRMENIGDFDERLFGAHHRRSFVKAIRKYTDIPIEGLKYVPGEKRVES